MVISTLPKTLFFLALMFVASMNCFNIVQQPSLGRPFGHPLLSYNRDAWTHLKSGYGPMDGWTNRPTNQLEDLSISDTGDKNDENAVVRLQNDIVAQTSEQGCKLEGQLVMAQRQKRAEVERSLDAVTFNIVRSDTTLFMSRTLKLNPAAASAKCRSLNGELASLTSLRKLKIVKENGGGLLGHWTSGKKNLATNKWRWGTGELIRPSAREFYPSNPHSYDCLLYYSTSESESESESEEFFPCVDACTAEIACESDGLKLPNNEFLAFPLKKTYIIVQHSKINYTEAEADCAKRGPNAHLATPTSFKELDLIDKSMGNLRNLWLGGKRDEVYEGGKWVTGEPIAIVSNLRKRRVRGECLLYCDKEFFDWFECDGVEGDKWSDGYVCQIDE